jgi:hypothetical protein
LGGEIASAACADPEPAGPGAGTEGKCIR